VHHRTIHINHQPIATIFQFIILTFVYSSTAQWLQWQPLVLPSYRGDSHAATAVIELLMMGGKTPETCWAVNKRHDNKLEKLLHQVGDLFELNVKLRCQKVTSQVSSWFLNSDLHII